MRGSSSLGTILEASTYDEGFGTRKVEPWEGYVHTTLAGISTSNLNNFRVRVDATK
jgi:hypothetical protein